MSHLEHLRATEDQARSEGELTWAIHVLMMEEVERWVEEGGEGEKGVDEG